ncbi:uncharacterized protein AMSG_07354 [Thecamonas trahens ATCC 50062]|uniref:Neutral/alkaline non-lysosomal ceramidase N-terminal domain-containing protein n=1 Tax=Thecamonas trahens ATCC 50062 TaxID=461836 RepID=A0A0L0DG84_THETB|nr:hypothetical protein AMSG_07354 [Thecamonas trahens ATCC 50062]KNC51339.1 hypothetical protein AMSG_07354 [Thecamonas trahens ATCC 50062]|eukprot:XP_013756259.1 hypothetical protein AMSG_07354 [Thecamonas trahens ATCC 50062]
MGLATTTRGLHAKVSSMAVVAVVAARVTFGRGIRDVTGPATEVDFMGYAEPSQTGGGLHFRLHARAMVF